MLNLEEKAILLWPRDLVLREFDVENDNLEMFLLCLTTFSAWTVAQRLHEVTSWFGLQYMLTCAVNVLKFQPIIYYDKTNVKLSECFFE